MKSVRAWSVLTLKTTVRLSFGAICMYSVTAHAIAMPTATQKPPGETATCSVVQSSQTCDRYQNSIGKIIQDNEKISASMRKNGGGRDL
jgi:hypothetical protein